MATFPEIIRDLVNFASSPNTSTSTQKLTSGENPYMFIAEKLGFHLKMQERILEYYESPRSDEDYQALVDWEIASYRDAYFKKYGKYPKRGDLEALLPVSVSTSEAKDVLPIIHSKGIKCAIISSGFSDLVSPAARDLDIAPGDAYANSFLYDNPDGTLSGVKINVNGKKLRVLDIAINKYKALGISSSEVAYVGDNNWDLDAIYKILDLGGTVFYLQPDGSESGKMYPLSDESLFDKERFVVIKSLVDILSYHKLSEIKAIIYDADGTIINTQ